LTNLFLKRVFIETPVFACNGKNIEILFSIEQKIKRFSKNLIFIEWKSNFNIKLFSFVFVENELNLDVYNVD